VATGPPPLFLVPSKLGCTQRREPMRKPKQTSETEAPGGDARATLGTKIPLDLMGRLRLLAARVSMQEGRRVTIEALVEEALRDLLEKRKG